jgi:hypothetical protein
VHRWAKKLLGHLKREEGRSMKGVLAAWISQRLGVKVSEDTLPDKWYHRTHRILRKVATCEKT